MQSLNILELEVHDHPLNSFKWYIFDSSYANIKFESMYGKPHVARTELSLWKDSILDPKNIFQSLHKILQWKARVKSYG